MIEKRCTKCGQSKILECFNKDNSARDGLCCWCRDCQKDNIRLWKERDPEGYKLSARRRLLRHRYGLELEEVEQMIEDQNNKCKICGLEFSVCKKTPSVDHCHDTGKVRGILCSKCNTFLGWYEKNINVITEYLQ